MIAGINEQKVTATQNAEKAERDLARIKFEAKQAYERAQGEAQAIEVRTRAINAQGGEGYLLSPGAPLPFISIK